MNKMNLHECTLYIHEEFLHQNINDYLSENLPIDKISSKIELMLYLNLQNAN